MAARPSWPPTLSPQNGPLYLQIVDAIEQAVERGELREGDRLPPQRALAETVSVDLTTVTRAYTEARRRGLIDAVTGRGSFIAPRRGDDGPALDLSMNIPPAPRGVRLADALRRGVQELAARTDVDQVMSYHPGAGASADRAAAAAWLRPRFGELDPDRILVAAGAQTAMAAIVTRLAAPGETIACEPLVYPGVLSLARCFGHRLAAVEADAEGMLPEALERLCAASPTPLLYLNPTIANPTAATMSEGRRADIIATARRHGLQILEDDPYSPLAADAPTPLAALAPDLVWHVHTLSKCLTPGLRVAFVVAPSRKERSALVPTLRALSLMPSPLATALLGGWIRDGLAADILKGVREEAAARQALARSILPAAAPGHPNAIHLWLPLPDGWDRGELAARARRSGLAVTSSDAFNASATAPQAVRISLGAVRERSRLAGALTTLAEILREDASARTEVV